MNDQTFPRAHLFRALSDAQIPEVAQELAVDTVTKARAVYDTVHSAAKSGRKTLETFLQSAGSGARAVNSKVLDNIASNTEAAFEAAQAIARAETFLEAAQLHAKFVQQQFVTAGGQARELLDLYAHVSAKTFDSLHRAANTR